MKFIHTSDWHLGRQFHNVSLLEDQRHVLNQLIAMIEQHQVDALVIAGDIYDRSVPPAVAVELLDEVLHRVCHELQVPVLLITGNHDSAERLRFGSRQLSQSGLHIFGDVEQVNVATTLTGKSGITVNFYGIPYHDPEQIRHIFDASVTNHDDAHRFVVDRIKSDIEDKKMTNDDGESSINVLISHCFVDGAQECESERPLSIGGADRVSYEPLLDFNYVALGHLHGPQYKGNESIRYSGSLLKYSFSEKNQKKGVNLVELDDEGKPKITRLAFKPLRDLRVLEGKMDDLLAQGKTDPNNDDYVMIILTDTHAILDAIGKLREVYPNVLHLEKPGMMSAGDAHAMNREKLKQNEIDMFRDFYQQTSGNDLTSEQDQALTEVINQLRKQMAEA